MSLQKGNDFETLKKLHAESNMAAEKNILERAIGHAKDESSIEQALTFALSDQVRNCDQLYILSEVAVNSDEGLLGVWSLIKDRLEFLKENFGGQFQLSGFFKTVLSQFSQQSLIDEAKTYFRENPVENSTMAINQGLESAQLNVQWYSRDGDQIKQKLENYAH